MNDAAWRTQKKTMEGGQVREEERGHTHATRAHTHAQTDVRVYESAHQQLPGQGHSVLHRAALVFCS